MIFNKMILGFKFYHRYIGFDGKFYGILISRINDHEDVQFGKIFPIFFTIVFTKELFTFYSIATFIASGRIM